MSYYEALKDEIRIKPVSSRLTLYYPKCHICGAEVESWSYIQTHVYTCKRCKEVNAVAIRELSKDLREEEKTKKLENAIIRINKVADITKYEKAITIVKKHLGKIGWFESTEEIMAALELLRRGIKFNHQVKLGKYRLDFVLPDDKIVVEVDGALYHRQDTREREKERDSFIILKLGLEWEVIRISTDHINKNVSKLYTAIKAVRKERERMRADFNGKLPKWHSDTAV